MDYRDIQQLKAFFSALKTSGFKQDLKQIPSFVTVDGQRTPVDKAHCLSLLRSFPQFQGDKFKDDNAIIKYLSDPINRKFLLGNFTQAQQIELTKALEEKPVAVEEVSGQPSGQEGAIGEPPATMTGGGIPNIPPAPSIPSAPRVIRNIPHAPEPPAQPETPESKLYVANKSGTVVEERTITPTSSTVKKPEAPSKLYIANKSGTIVGERSIPPGPKFQAPKVPYGVSNAAKNLGSGLGRFTKVNSSRVANGFGNLLGGLGRAGGDALGGGIGVGGRALGRFGLKTADFGARLSSQISGRGLSSGLKKGFGTGKKVAIASALFMMLFLGSLIAAIIPGSNTVPTGFAAPISTSNSILDYTLPIKDPGVVSVDIRAAVLAAYPKAKIEYWDQIIAQARGYGLNPALALALWIEETGASQYTLIANGGGGVPNAEGKQSTGHLGCAPGEDQTVDESVRCLYNFITRNNFTNDQFATFMARYSGGPANAPFSNNPYFVKNFRIWYQPLVPSGPGVLVAVTAPTTAQPPASIGFSLSCPVGVNPRLTCGTAANPVNNCGHGVAPKYNTICNPYYYVCVGDKYSEALYHAIDVVGTTEVRLPFINRNEPVTWTRAESKPIAIGENAEWGYRVNYTTNYQGKQLYLDLTHLNPQINNSSTLNSGELVGTVFPGIGHLHTAISVDGRWVEPIQDAGMCSR